MAFRVARAEDAHWRPSNEMKVQNTNLSQQLEMTQDRLAFLYPDGPRALPPELGGEGSP